MPWHAPEPVLRVRVIRLTAMQDRVPVASFDGVEILTNGMRFVEEIVTQPKPREAGGGKVAILRFGWKDARQRLELHSHGEIGGAHAEIIEAILGKKRTDFGKNVEHVILPNLRQTQYTARRSGPTERV